MRLAKRREHKILTAVVAGLLVWLISTAANLALVPQGRGELVRQLVANFIGGLMAVIISLALQLRSEEVHYAAAIDRAAIVAELNHNVRNAVFPLCIAVQKMGNADVNRMADDAMDRINVALRDATADALTGRVDYAGASTTENVNVA